MKKHFKNEIKTEFYLFVPRILFFSITQFLLNIVKQFRQDWIKGFERNSRHNLLIIKSLSFSFLFILLAMNTSNAQQGAISHFDVNGSWSGNDANGNALLNGKSECVRMDLQMESKVFASSIDGEGAGVENAQRDDALPGSSNPDSCYSGNWYTTSGRQLYGIRTTLLIKNTIFCLKHLS